MCSCQCLNSGWVSLISRDWLLQFSTKPFSFLTFFWRPILCYSGINNEFRTAWIVLQFKLWLAKMEIVSPLTESSQKAQFSHYINLILRMGSGHIKIHEVWGRQLAHKGAIWDACILHWRASIGVLAQHPSPTPYHCTPMESLGSQQRMAWPFQFLPPTWEIQLGFLASDCPSSCCFQYLGSGKLVEN